MKSAISQIRQNDVSTHPFVFNEFNFDIFSRYLTSRKKMIKVKRMVQCNEDKREAGNNNNNNIVEDDVAVYFSDASVSGM